MIEIDASVFFLFCGTLGGWAHVPKLASAINRNCGLAGMKNGSSVLNPGPPHGQTGFMNALARRVLLTGGLSWAGTRKCMILGHSPQCRSWAERMPPK